MDCPRCKSTKFVKDGMVKGKQRYQCHSCHYRYTVAYRGKGEHVKRYALMMYLEGLGFRSIGRILEVSHVAVYQWIKKFGGALEALKSTEEVKVVEMDEMHTYVGVKKTPAGYGWLWKMREEIPRRRFGHPGNRNGYGIMDANREKKHRERHDGLLGAL